MYKFCHCLTKPIITRIIVSLVLENIIIRITRIIVSLMFKNVIIRIEVFVFREVTFFTDFITLVKYVQILSLFNQAHYYTNYCVFNV